MIVYNFSRPIATSGHAQDKLMYFSSFSHVFTKKKIIIINVQYTWILRRKFEKVNWIDETIKFIDNLENSIFFLLLMRLLRISQIQMRQLMKDTDAKLLFRENRLTGFIWIWLNQNYCILRIFLFTRLWQHVIYIL